MGMPKHILLGFEIEPKGKTPSLFQQVHGKKIMPFPHPTTSLLEADGGMTFESNLELYVFSADCMPVLFFSENPAEPIAAIHSGWRGTKEGILKEAVSLFKDLEALHVWIGPHIKKCCFEVKEDFIEAFQAAGRDPLPFLNQGKFDLLSFALATDLKGISPQKVHLADSKCTLCSIPALPSYRRQKNTDPRIRSWIKKG